VIYGLACGATERGVHYLGTNIPGWGGWVMFGACPIAVFMAGAKIIGQLRRSRVSE
jgi:hypothetical protein